MQNTSLLLFYFDRNFHFYPINLLKHLKLVRKLKNRNNPFNYAYLIQQKLEKKKRSKNKNRGKNGVNVFKNYLNQSTSQSSNI